MKTALRIQFLLVLFIAFLQFNSNAQIDHDSCPVATISYTGTPYCSDAGQATVTLLGNRGGIFTAGPGLVIDADYGFVDLAASIPGTYTVTYTIPAANGCPDLVTTTDITVNPAPTAAFSYPGSPFCTGQGTVSPVFNGTTGGVFSSDPGIVVDSSTGDINMESSVPGSFTVSYNVSIGNCTTTATTTVVITPQPNATIDYGSSPICTTAGIASVVLTGTTGGTFSADPGVTINSITGDIDLTATAPGSYTVTYSIASAGSCGNFSTTTGITIVAGAIAKYYYPNSPYCILLDTAMVVFYGTPGGTFGADPGLVIDPVTGTVDIQSSIPGTYNVYYKLYSPCGLISNSASITLDNTNCRPVSHAPSAFTNGTISVYPNPVNSRGLIKLHFNGLAEGVYVVKLFNGSGTNLLVKQFFYKGGSIDQSMALPEGAVKGIYHIEIMQPNGVMITRQILITE